MTKTLLLCAAAALFVVGCQGKSEDSASGAGSASNSASKPSTDTSTPSGKGFVAVQSILAKNCAGCHGENRPKGRINVTSFDTIMKGGEDGPIVNPGDPENSVLIQALRGAHGKRKMPPRGSLPEDQIKTIEDWIKDGAKKA